MDKQSFIDDYLTRNAAQVRRKGITHMTQIAEAEFAASQDPHTAFLKQLKETGKYWISEDGAKARVYFNCVDVPGSNRFVDGYYDIHAGAWIVENCDKEAFIAAAMSGK